MELLLLLGLAALTALVAFGLLTYLRQRRAGTVLAVSIPLRTLHGPDRTDRTPTGHR